MKFKIAIVCVLAFASCMQTRKDTFTDKFEKGQRLAELKTKKLKEVSGIAASVTNPGMLWALNDSGNKAELYLIDKNLNIVYTCSLAGLENRDWEDISVGPGPDSNQSYIYVGDIGDNEAVYPYKYIYRLREPRVRQGRSDTTVAAVDKIVFKLPNAIKDTESLMIDHKTKDLYVVSKREDPVYVYKLKYPYSTTDTLTATETVSLPFASIVSADYQSGSGDVVMKNYDHIYYWENSRGEDVSTLLKRKPVEVAYESEPQGESIAWATDGSGFYTISEVKKKEKSYLYFYKRK
ncbi:hypothetical protein ACFQ21_29825 [Ohtaekwangia kribbensis]|jgi:hypothetical protein|uniref:PE-PGRS family protein n=1 Tax=Ohtaekwangia kribbensis TaxID=688913 RepID=A0ABW3KEF3_9BACT